MIAYSALKQPVVYWNMFMNLKLRYGKRSKDPKFLKRNQDKNQTLFDVILRVTL